MSRSVEYQRRYSLSQSPSDLLSPFTFQRYPITIAVGNDLGGYGSLSFPSIILSSGNTVSHVLCHHADYFMILYLLLAMYRYPNGSCHFNGAK